MITFFFTVLCFALFAVILLIGYFHLRRESERQWKRYARRATTQVKTLRLRLVESDAALKAHIEWTANAIKTTKPNAPVSDLSSFNPRAKMEDIAERQILEAHVLEKKTA